MVDNNLNYLKAIVIVHGKSEYQLCNFIKNKLRINMHIESDKKGEKSIQITSVNKRLTNMHYKSKALFLKQFPYVEMNEENKTNKKGKSKNKITSISDSFKIFIIMDMDDCTEEDKMKYLNKDMFKKHWAYKYIVPIYNDTNLEDVMVKCGIKFEKKGEERKKEYIKIFPTDKKYIKKDTMQVEEFNEKLRNCKSTNMEVFIDFCLNVS